jgi:hypothetical protein
MGTNKSELEIPLKAGGDRYVVATLMKRPLGLMVVVILVIVQGVLALLASRKAVVPSWYRSAE